MSITFSILAVVAMLAVLGVLGLGMVSMVRGGEFNKKHGNKLMRWRVGLQAAALVLVAIAILASKQ